MCIRDSPYVPPIINPSYGVTVAPTDNGVVTVSPAAAQQGQTVTVTAVPSEGYELSALTITCLLYTSRCV